MLKVKLEAMFFAGGQRYRKGVVELPDNLRDKLPSRAVILSEDEREPVAAPVEPSALEAADPDRAAAEAEEKARLAAEAVDSERRAKLAAKAAEREKALAEERAEAAKTKK